MGVHGLWQLLSSTGKPVPLESLEGKVLAVDVSVWLHQLSKGMRDGSGNPLPNAHLHGLFTRICKLLYYRIKPVFVFDGGVPTLKKQTLASRRNKREDAEKSSSLMQQKILTNLIRSQALKEACGLDKLPDLPSSSKSSAKGNKEVLYQLPPLPDASKSYMSEKSVEDENDIDRWELQQMVEDEYGNINQIDVESSDFKALPAEVQHEVITDIRLSRKNYNLSRIVDLPDEATDFSKYQMSKLVKHNRLNTRLDEIRKELNDRQTRALTKNYGKRFDQMDNIYSQKVISDDSSHYILAKRNLQRKKEVENERNTPETHTETFSERVNMISDTDELLIDSDSDSCQEVDILEESRLIQEEINGFVDGSLESGSVTNQSKKPEIHHKLQREDKPRFRAVIEVDSDSGTDSSEDGVEIVGTGDNQVVVIDDGTVDRDLQLAIEESLKETRKAKSEISTNGSRNVIEDNNGKVIEDSLAKRSESDITYSTGRVPVVTAGKKRKKLEDKHVLDIVNIEDDCTNQKSKSSKEMKVDNKQNLQTFGQRSFTQRIDTTSEVTTKVKGQIEVPVVRNKRPGIFKRNISSVSDGSDDSDEGCRKVQRLESVESVCDVKSEVSSEADDDFIEVKVDLTKMKEDDMFPASMFEQDDTEEECVKQDSLDTKYPTKQSCSKNIINVDDKSNIESKEINKRSLTEMELDVIEAKDVAKESSDDLGKKDDLKADTAEVSVTMETNADITMPESSEVTNKEESSSKRPQSPPVTNLVRQFESLNEQRVRGMRDNLATENRQLRLEQGRQERLAVSITDQMHSEAQELLQLFGIPYIVSPTEAEAQCAQLEIIKLTNGTITDDSDIWLFGGKCVFKNFFNQQKHVECFKDVNISAQLGLSRDSLINIALLCGSDYTEGIKGVGPVTAMEILAKFPGPGIEGLNKFKAWWDEAQREIKVPLKQSKFLAKLRELDIHSGFPSSPVVEAYLKPTVDDSSDKFTWSLPNLEHLRQFATSKLKWTREKTDELLLPVLKRLNEKQSQRSISAFFHPETYINPVPVKSKRLQKVVEKFINPGEENDQDIEDEKEENGKKSRKRAPKEQSDSADKITKRKTRSKADKGQDSGDKVEKKETEKSDKSRRTRSTKTSRKMDTVGKAVETDENSVCDVNDDTKETKPKGRASGHGREASQRSTRSKQNLIESQSIILGSSSSSDDSDSSMSSMSDSEFECESIEGSDYDDDISVVETGLNIREILKLKMGCKIDEIDIDKDQKETRKVVENVVNVNEILHLESGTGDIEVAEEMGDIGKEDVDSSKERIDLENFANEGGFIREEDEDEIKNKTEKNFLEGTKQFEPPCPEESSETISCKQELKRTRSRRTNTKDQSGVLRNAVKEEISVKDKGVVDTEGTGAYNSGTKELPDTKILNVTKSDAAKETKTCAIESMENITKTKENTTKTKENTTKTKKNTNSTENTSKSSENSTKSTENTTKANENITQTKEKTTKTVKQATSVYSIDPIKPVVSGLPWADKSKGRRKAGSGKGQGKTRLHTIMPVESFVKKAKPKESKKTFGSVNLSESDSD